MSNWDYVAIAYTVGWGSIAAYALVLARRVTQARRVAQSLKDATQTETEPIMQDTAVCDGPPAP